MKCLTCAVHRQAVAFPLRDTAAHKPGTNGWLKFLFILNFLFASLLHTFLLVVLSYAPTLSRSPFSGEFFYNNFRCWYGDFFHMFLQSLLLFSPNLPVSPCLRVLLLLHTFNSRPPSHDATHSILISFVVHFSHS